MTTPDSQRVVPVEPTDFYMQDSRRYVGNYMLFWANGVGYTTSLDEAEVFTKDRALSQNASRPTDIPWPAAYLRSKSRPAVDFQYVRKADAESFAAAPAASPPVAPPAAAQEGVKPIPACWRYVHADPSNSSGWMDYDGDAKLWALRAKHAQANGLTIELAYSRPPAQADHEGV